MRGDIGFQNIVEADGIGLALTGMSIVFLALTLVSLLLVALPRVLARVKTILPEPEPEKTPGDPDEEMAVALACAFLARGRPERKASTPKH